MEIEDRIIEKLQAERANAAAGSTRPAAPGPKDGWLTGTLSGAIKGKTLSPDTVTAMTIEERMQKLIEQMGLVRANAQFNAVTLAGHLPVPAEPPMSTAFTYSEGTIFERYAQALDEIDRIVDNVRRDLTRTREVLGG